MTNQPTPNRILVIKLADMGDVLTATPALRALRQAFPDALIDLLLTHHTKAVMEHSQLVDHLIPSDNFRFFNPKEVLKPGLLREAWSVLREIRWRGYDTVLVLHHLTTRAGAMKYAAIAKISGASVIAGLDPGGSRGAFLTHTIPDEGFGTRHEIDYWLAVAALIGAKSDDREMELAVSAADRAWVDLALTVNVGPKGARKPIVVVHPGSGGYSLARRWSPQNFAQVADALADEGAQIILVGTPADGTDRVRAAMHSTPLDLTGETSLHQLEALLGQADLFIGGDSGVTHMAAASGTPLVVVFGPSNAAAWGPTGPQRHILQAPIPCGPCAYVEHQVGLRTGCPARTCLKLITPAQVLAVAQSILEADAVTAPFPSSSWQQVSPPDVATAHILDVRVHAITFTQTVQLIETFIASQQPHQIVTVNPEFVVTAQKDDLFRRIINRAALAFPDGTGLLWAARQLQQPTLPERVAGVDIVEALAQLSAQKGYRLYFLGAQPGVAEQAVQVLQGRYPTMVLAGVFAGSPKAEDEDEIVAKIQAAQPDVVFVAYGAPNQDKWIARNMLRLPASVLIGVGGAFDFISGTTKRAPVWVRQLRLEWLHRLVRQPSRWRRIWNAVPRFMTLVLLAKRRES